jgi:hypothetical protein
MREGEPVSPSKLEELILDHVAWETSECGSSPGMLDGLIRAYVKAKEFELEQEDDDAFVDCTDGEGAWQILRKFYFKGFCAAYDKDIPKENEDHVLEGFSFPESISHTRLEVLPVDLCEKMGFVIGHMDGRHSVAMRKYAEEMEAKRKASNG